MGTREFGWVVSIVRALGVYVGFIRGNHVDRLRHLKIRSGIM
jgi:hypothetical protein